MDEAKGKIGGHPAGEPAPQSESYGTVRAREGPLVPNVKLYIHREEPEEFMVGAYAAKPADYRLITREEERTALFDRLPRPLLARICSLLTGGWNFET